MCGGKSGCVWEGNELDIICGGVGSTGPPLVEF